MQRVLTSQQRLYRFFDDILRFVFISLSFFLSPSIGLIIYPILPSFRQFPTGRNRYRLRPVACNIHDKTSVARSRLLSHSRTTQRMIFSTNPLDRVYIHIYKFSYLARFNFLHCWPNYKTLNRNATYKTERCYTRLSLINELIVN